MTLAKTYKMACRKPRVGHCSPQTSLRVRSTEDEDSPKGYRSPKPATTYSVAGRKALFAGAGGQLGFFRQTEPLKHKALTVLFFPQKKNRFEF